MDADYSRRFLTFANFPLSSPASERHLAAAGFVYNGDGRNDEVFCSHCGKCFRNWTSDKVPLLVHERQSPNCPFITTQVQPERMDVGNSYDSQLQSNTQNVPPEHTFKEENQCSIASSHSVSGNPVCQPSEDDDVSPNYRPNLEQSICGPMSGSQTKQKQILQDSPVNSYLSGFNGLRVNDQPSQMERNSLQQRHQSYRSQNSNSHQNSSELRNGQDVLPQNTNSNNSFMHSQNLLGPHRTNVNQNIPNQQGSLFETTPPLRNIPQQDSIVFQNPHSNSINATGQQWPQMQNGHRVDPQSNSINTTSQQMQPMPNGHRVDVKSNEDAMRLVQSTSQGQQQWLNPRQSVTNNTNIDYTNTRNRIQSYVGRWPEGHFLQPEELAEAGLYYTGPNDRTQCAWCRGGLLNWEMGDTALGEHQRHFPECNFIRQKIASLLSGRPMQPIPNRNDDDDDEYEIVRTTVPLRRQPPMNNHVPSMQQNSNLQSFPHQQPNHSQARQQEQSLQEVTTHVRQILGCSEDIIHGAIRRLRASGVTNITADVLMNAVLDEQSVDIMPAHNQISADGPPSDADSTDSSTNTSATNTSTAENVPTCKVCLTRGVEMLFLPCRHLVCCEQCATRVQTCPFCRVDIAGTVKAFIP